MRYIKQCVVEKSRKAYIFCYTVDLLMKDGWRLKMTELWSNMYPLTLYALVRLICDGINLISNVLLLSRVLFAILKVYNQTNALSQLVMVEVDRSMCRSSAYAWFMLPMKSSILVKSFYWGRCHSPVCMYVCGMLSNVLSLLWLLRNSDRSLS